MTPAVIRLEVLNFAKINCDLVLNHQLHWLFSAKTTAISAKIC